MSEIGARTLEALQGSPPPNPSSINQDGLRLNARIHESSLVLPRGRNSKRWAGALRDDPFWDDMMAAIKAERAEVDAAQE